MLTTTQIRTYLRAVDPRFFTPFTICRLEDALPQAWQRLIGLHGHAAVFDCLKRGDDVQRATERLPMTKPSGGEIYWRRYAAEEQLGKPVRVVPTDTGYRIVWPRKVIDTPFVGGIRRKRKLIADIQRWINE